MIKTVTLTGEELEVKNLCGFNTLVHNLSDGAVYASKYPNIEAGADNVAEIPPGAAKLLSTTNGTVYLIGTGKAELTGQDYDGVNFRQPSSSGNGGGGTSDVTKAYVTAQDAENLARAKAYTNSALSVVNENIVQAQTAAETAATKADANAADIAVLQTAAETANTGVDANAADIAALQTAKADKTDIPTTLPADGGNADTVNGHTVNADVPEGAKFTDTTYGVATQSEDGLMSAADKTKLDGITASENNYSIPAATASALGGVKIGYTENGRNYPVQLSNEQMYVNVPWSDSNTTYSNMKGASASASGQAGLVPAPAAGAQEKYLRGDGTWQTPSNANTAYSAMTGATASAAGTAGIVPAPVAGAQEKYLCGNATWDFPLKAINVTTTGTNLNDYKTPGFYYFSANYPPTNVPTGTNGWLVVLTSNFSTIKQLWFRQGTADSNDFETYVRMISGSTVGKWHKFATVPAANTPQVIVAVVQGAVSGLSSSSGTYYVPYQTGASKALVEVWVSLNTTVSSTAIGRTVYGSRYMSGISSSMTKITATSVVNTANLNTSVGTDTTGRITFDSNVASATYRVTWFA